MILLVLLVLFDDIYWFMMTTTKKHLVGSFPSTKMERFVSDLNAPPAVAATLEEEVLGQVEHLAEPVHRHLQYNKI